MFTSTARVEVLNNVGHTNERVDALSLETSEELVKAQLNINKVGRWVTELDHQADLLEESGQHY